MDSKAEGFYPAGSLRQQRQGQSVSFIISAIDRPADAERDERRQSVAKEGKKDTDAMEVKAARTDGFPALSLKDGLTPPTTDCGEEGARAEGD